MWTDIARTVAHWPWGTIAAFSATAVAVYIARADIRERRQLLGRGAIAEVAAASISWQLAGNKFLGTARRAANQPGASAELGGEAFTLVSTAYASTVRVFTSAKLVCNDPHLLDCVLAAETKLAAFMTALGLPVPDSPDEERERIARIIESGDKALADFLHPIEAFINRGFDLYSPRPSLRVRWLTATQ